MPARSIFTVAEDYAIMAQRTTDAELAERINRTVAQILDRRNYLRNRQPRMPGRRRSVCYPHAQTIRALLACGNTLIKVATELEVSLGAVAGFVRRRKLRQAVRF